MINLDFIGYLNHKDLKITTPSREIKINIITLYFKKDEFFYAINSYEL